jgi:hypothetical protein
MLIPATVFSRSFDNVGSSRSFLNQSFNYVGRVPVLSHPSMVSPLCVFLYVVRCDCWGKGAEPVLALLILHISTKIIRERLEASMWMGCVLIFILQLTRGSLVNFYILIDELITLSKQLFLNRSFNNTSKRTLPTIQFVGHKT